MADEPTRIDGKNENETEVTPLENGMGQESKAPEEQAIEVNVASKNVSPEQGNRVTSPTLTEFLSSVVERVQDLAQTGVKLSTQTVSKKVSKIKGELEEGGESQDPTAAEVVNLAIERLKRRGIQGNLDLKELLKTHFSRFVHEKVKEGESATTEDGEPKSVTIDGDFVLRYGQEIIPSLLGGVAQSIFSNMTGVEEENEEPPTPDIQVKFDFSSVIGKLMEGGLSRVKVVKETEEAEERGDEPSSDDAAISDVEETEE